jgi:hypothetical protein
VNATFAEKFNGSISIDLAELEQLVGGANAEVLAIQSAIPGLSEHVHVDISFCA